MITRALASLGAMFGMKPRKAKAAPRLEPGCRVYAVGDVHGRLEQLAALHRAVGQDLAARPAARPLLVHLGDFIDRGPCSAGVLALLRAGPPLPGVPVVNLMGNHESMFLSALDRRDSGEAGHWLDTGGAETLASWGILPSTPLAQWAELAPRADVLFLRGLESRHQSGQYLFVHAGVRPGVALAEQDPADLLWIRGPFLRHRGPLLPDAPDMVVVHGHTPHPEPVVRANRIGVDTGAGRGGPLTCAVLEGDAVRFLQAWPPTGG